MNVCAFLESEALRPFEWGVTDCATTADRWFASVHGFSPMGRFGRRIIDEETGHAWLGQPGGLLRGVCTVMRRSGIKTCNARVVAGDIGVITVDNRVCIGIYDGALWRSRDVDGLIATDDTHRYKAWEVLSCRRL